MQLGLEPKSASQWWRTFQTWSLWPLRRKGRCCRNSSPWRMWKRSSELQTEQVFLKASHFSNYLLKSSASSCHFGGWNSQHKQPNSFICQGAWRWEITSSRKAQPDFVSPSSFLNRLWPARISVGTSSLSSLFLLPLPSSSLFPSLLLSPPPFHCLSFPSFISSHAFLFIFPCPITSFFLFLFFFLSYTLWSLCTLGIVVSPVSFPPDSCVSLTLPHLPSQVNSVPGKACWKGGPVLRARRGSNWTEE